MDLMFVILLVIFRTEYAFTGRCQHDQAQCRDGKCISVDYTHDLIADCNDNSDVSGGSRLGCLQRHDIYGMKYNDYYHRKTISKNGTKCSGRCVGKHGYGIVCAVSNDREYCHVPFCNILDNDNRVVCDFAASFCGYKVRSNATVQQSISKEGEGVVKITGEGTTRTTIVSSIVFTYHLFAMNYTVNKSSNCVWSIFESSEAVPSSWNTKNCTKCKHIKGEAKRVAFSIWITGYGIYEFQLSFSVFEWEPNSEYEPCEKGQILCDRFCKDYSIFQDGVQDCYNTDEGRIHERCHYSASVYDCSQSEIRCNGSGKCMPKIFPPSMKEQCISKQKSFPYQRTDTKCTSAYICRRSRHMRNDPFLDNETICLSETEICDGIPQCPYWDDEASCATSYCPLGCTVCTNYMYKCLPSAILYIPSDAIDIDVSGNNLNLSELCMIRRPRLLYLNVSKCNLSDTRCISSSFPNLIHLDVSYNSLVSPFINTHYDMTAILDGNPIIALSSPCSIIIHHLSLRNVGIKSIYGVYDFTSDTIHYNFRGNVIQQKYRSRSMTISHADLRDNELESLSIIEEHDITHLDISRNRIVDFPHFRYRTFIVTLILHDNMLTHLSNISLSKMERLQVLDLSKNIIKGIERNAFLKNVHLRELYLHKNVLRILKSSLFFQLKKLEILRLDHNLIDELPTELFSFQSSLTLLNLKNNNLVMIPKGFFRNMPSLRSLDVSGNDIRVYEKIFDGLVLQFLMVDKFSLCCARPRSVTVAHCHALNITVSSCSFLLQSWFLGVYFWYIAMIISFSNTVTIFQTLKKKLRSNDWKTLFSVHMSIADLTMCIYIVIICIKDVDMKGVYGFEHDEWPDTVLCRALQLLSAVSLEVSSILSVVASTLTLTSYFDMKGCQMKRLCAFAWIWSCVLAIVYFTINKLTAQGLSSCTQICIITPIIYQQRRGFGEGGQTFNWILLWMILHSITALFVLCTGIFNCFRRGSLQLDKQLTVTLSAVIIRDLFLCISGCIQMAVPIPDVFHELTLFIIPTCSLVGTLARFLLKSTYELQPDIKEVINCKLPTDGQFMKGNTCVWKIMIVLDPSLKSEIKCILKAADINVEVSDQTGWKRTFRKIRILRHIMICEAQFRGLDLGRMLSPLVIKISKKSNGTCISQSSMTCEHGSIMTFA